MSPPSFLLCFVIQQQDSFIFQFGRDVGMDVWPGVCVLKIIMAIF